MFFSELMSFNLVPVVVQVLAVDGLECDGHQPRRDPVLDGQHVQRVQRRRLRHQLHVPNAAEVLHVSRVVEVRVRIEIRERHRETSACNKKSDQTKIIKNQNKQM